MKYKDIKKKGVALSLVLAMGVTALPVNGLAGINNVYAAEATQEVFTQNFDSGINGWYYGAGWEYQYSGAENSKVEAKDGRLNFTVDYSKDKSQGWSQATAVYEPSTATDFSGASQVKMDFYYDASKLTAGSFKIKLYAETSAGNIDTNVDVDTAKAEAVSGDIKKVPVTLGFDALAEGAKLTKFAIQLIGANTDYKGDVAFDNLIVARVPVVDTWSVDSTIAVKDASKQQAAVTAGKLSLQKKDGTAEEIALTDSISLVDPKATDNTKQIYAYLKAVGESESVIFGHENDLTAKAGALTTSKSDVYDITKSISGVYGLDAQMLNGDEYTADQYAKDYPDEAKPANGIEVAARLSNKVIEQGALVTLAAHMPNFSLVKQNENYNSGVDPIYKKWDFSGYTAPDASNDVMNQILPGGKYNAQYTAYLDMIAEYAKQVNGTIQFRPFHEGTGSWFWWGAAYCDAETYKSVWRYTVEYLRDTKNVHNLLYVYSPSNTGSGSEAALKTRYPGDGYVDIIGFDMYDSKPSATGTWMNAFKEQLAVVDAFAKKHGKLSIVAETGASNDPEPGSSQTALLKQGNGNKDWYNQVLDIVSQSQASYFLVWANWGKNNSYYTPYVDSVNADGTLHGHEMLDYFISFYNDGRSIFAANQKDALKALSAINVTAVQADDEVQGYFTSPIAGSRVLKATKINAKVSGVKDTDKVKFVLNGKKKVTLTAKKKAGDVYTASLSAKQLATLGKKTGTLSLYVGSKKIQSLSMIYNIKAPELDACLIDNFDSYLGVNDLLNKTWAPNVGSDCSLTLSLDKSKNTEGTYGLKFVYDETADGGYAGANINKEVDWSNCNAVSFTMVPDGKNQKTVIQINANGVTYETYLNTYSAFKKNGKKPILVTIPFSEFCERDTEGNPKGGLVKNAGKITQFGLYINAIKDSGAVSNGRVKGTLYFDNITAVKVKSKKISFDPVSGTTYKNLQKQKVSLKKTKVTLKKGKSTTLKATVSGKGDTTLTWYSTKPSVVKVSSTGKITAKKAGTAKVIVKTRSGKKAVCTVTVK